MLKRKFHSIGLIVLSLLTTGISFTQISPNSIAGLKVWLAADSSMILSGSSVQQWNDISGNNNHFISPSSTYNPTKVFTSSLNGKPYLNFDGTDKLESNTNFTLNNATIFIVSTQNTGDAAFGRTLDHGYNNGFWFGKGNGAAMGGGFYEGAAPYGNFESVISNTPTVLTMVRTGATTEYFKNGNPFTIPTRTTSSASTAFQKIVIGATISNDNFGKKNIYEVLLFNRALNTSEIDVIYEYLGMKYTQPINLGADIYSSNFCGESISGPLGYTSYLWSTGETTSNIVAQSSGTYWLLVKDTLGLTRRDSINVFLPTVPLASSSSICIDSSVTWDSGFSDLTNTFLWSNGATSSSLNIAVPGAYWVQITDTNGCAIFSDTLVFSVDNYKNEAFLGADTVVCSGNSIFLQVGSNSTTNYLWQDNSTQPFLMVNTSGIYSLMSTNVNGCVAHDTINVTVSGTAPNVNFSVQNGCLGSAVNFIDSSSDLPGESIVSWQWNFGDGQTSTNQNPSHAYLNSGGYSVGLYVLSSSGCGANLLDSLTIFTPPQANFSVAGLCSENTADLNDLTILGDEQIESYQWDFGQPGLGANNYSSDQNPTVYLPNAGTFTFTLSVLDFNNCMADTSFSVTIFPSPIVDFTISSACVGQPSIIVNNSTVNNPATYFWDFGDGTSSTLVTPAKSFTQYGTQDVSLTITSSDGCIADSVVSVAIHPYPVPFIEMGPVCVGTYMELKDMSSIPQGSIANVTWILNATDTLYGDSVNYLVTTFNQQQVKMIVESSEGCQSTVSKFFAATSELDAAFTMPSSIVADGIPIPFTNTSIGGSIFAWDFGDGTSSTMPAPNHVYSENWVDSQLQVQLIALNAIGCVDTAYRIVQVKSRLNDLVLGNLFYQKTGNLAIVGVEIKNEGSAPFSNVDLFLSSEKGPLFQETWNGTLQPNEHIIYLFQSKPVYNPSSSDLLTAYYCVDGSIVGLESKYENNRVCKNTENSNVILIPIYPNPASDVLELNLLVTENSTVSMDLVDERGRKILDFYQSDSLVAGLYHTTQDISRIEAGCYFIRMTANDTLSIQRLLIVR